MGSEWSLKRTFLRTLIIALVSSALAGIYTFLFGDFGSSEVKILLTTLSISYFSVTSLACAAAWEKATSRELALLGLLVSGAGFLLFVPGIWTEWWESEAIAKSSVILAIFAFSCAQVCLLALVQLKPSVRWLFFATAIAICGLAVQASSMIVFEWNDEWPMRFLGVLGILDGCGSLLVPVLFKLGGRAPAVSDGKRYDRIELTCPSCGHHATYPVGTFACSACSLEMRVEICGKPKPIPPKEYPAKVASA